MKLRDAIDLHSIYGQFMGYQLKDGYKIQRLQLLTPAGMRSIQLSKSAKASLFRLNLAAPLKPGTCLSLQVKLKSDRGQDELKAYEISYSDPELINQSVAPSLPCNSQAQTQIRVCDRGTCRKRGSQAVYAALTQEIRDRHLTDRIQVQTTGCLKACKHGVNVKVDGICHHQVSTSQSAELIRSVVNYDSTNDNCFRKL